MRVFVLNVQSKKLLRGVALGLVAALGAGCSSDFSRFAPQASDYTGSINQAQIIRKVSPSMPVAAQPFPDELPAPRLANSQPAPSRFGEPLYTGTVEGNSIRPTMAQAGSAIQRKVLAPVNGVASAANLQPMPAPISAARRAVTPEVLAAPEDMPVTLAKKAIQKPIKKLGVPAALDDTVTGAVDQAAPRVVRAVKQPLPIADDIVATEPDYVKAPKAVATKTLGSKPRVLGPVDDSAAAEPAPTKIVKPVQTADAKTPSMKTPTANGKYVTVGEGESIYTIANRLHMPSTRILAANGLPNGAKLKAGQRLIVPDASSPKLDTAATGSISTDTPLDNTPSPSKTPKRENVAVLPIVPQTKSKATTKDAVATAAPVKAKAKLPAGSYAVESGDSLYTIAKSHGITVAELKAANDVADGKLKIGQALKIPAKGTMKAAAQVADAKPKAKVAANPGIDPIVTGSAATSTKRKLGPTVDAVEPAPTPAKAVAVAPAKPSNEVIDEAEKDTAAAPDSTGISKLRWPVRGRTLTSFGQAGDGGHANDGVDISVPNGTPVKAAENGVVIYAGTGLKDFGNTVLVRHDNGLVTVYGNNGNINVKRGDKVKRGQELAKSGMSGNTKVPKLHFEVRKNSAPVNPSSYLE